MNSVNLLSDCEKHLIPELLNIICSFHHSTCKKCKKHFTLYNFINKRGFCSFCELPLNFFFSTNNSSALPLIALDFNENNINFDFT